MNLYIEQDALDAAITGLYELSPQDMVDYLIEHGYAFVEKPKEPTCTVCGEYARYRVTWLLPNARSNPASSGYRGDDISYCADKTTDRCEEHKSDRQYPMQGYEWCATRDLEWRRVSADSE